jgi:NAD(P)-dependent dehydrogenase (short-subunit alcohol dehydrogenase family)
MALADVATTDGYDVQMQTNHLSHFLLLKEVFPLLEKAAAARGEARVVHHSSLARFGEERCFSSISSPTGNKNSWQ